MDNHFVHIIICSLLTANVQILSILGGIQKLCGISISDQLKHMFSERWITQHCDIPARSAGNSLHVDPYTNFSLL
jgi:hypothetical protein